MKSIGLPTVSIRFSNGSVFSRHVATGPLKKCKNLWSQCRCVIFLLKSITFFFTCLSRSVSNSKIIHRRKYWWDLVGCFDRHWGSSAGQICLIIFKSFYQLCKSIIIRNNLFYVSMNLFLCYFGGHSSSCRWSLSVCQTLNCICIDWWNLPHLC